MTDDRGRTDVYAAETTAFAGTDLETVQSFVDIAAVIESVVQGTWWPGPPVQARPARRDAASSSARHVAGETTIRLATEQQTIATAAHELAHALAGPAAGHSPRFLVAYLDVVAVITNLDSRDRRHQLHVDQLRDAFAAAGLTVGDRHWPPPPEWSSTAIAL